MAPGDKEVLAGGAGAFGADAFRRDFAERSEAVGGLLERAAATGGGGNDRLSGGGNSLRGGLFGYVPDDGNAEGGCGQGLGCRGSGGPGFSPAEARSRPGERVLENPDAEAKGTIPKGAEGGHGALCRDPGRAFRGPAGHGSGHAGSGGSDGGLYRELSAGKGAAECGGFFRPGALRRGAADRRGGSSYGAGEADFPGICGDHGG